MKNGPKMVQNMVQKWSKTVIIAQKTHKIGQDDPKTVKYGCGKRSKNDIVIWYTPKNDPKMSKWPGFPNSLANTKMAGIDSNGI